MACNTCNKPSSPLFTIKAKGQQASEQVQSQDCGYTADMLAHWRDKFFCIRDKQLYNEIGITKTQLNAFIGVILSGTTYEYNICFLSSKLDAIQPYIIKILELDQC